MGCLYSDFEGMCQNYDEDENYSLDGMPWDGICIWEDDPDPSYSCEWYESGVNEDNFEYED